MVKYLKLLFIVLALNYQTALAQLVVETFGTGGNVFTMDFVTIANPNNAPDIAGFPNPVGSVAYTYNLGKYEVSRDQITKASSAGGLDITLHEMGSMGGNGLLKPATGISYYEAAKYVNWLNTSTGGTAAYKFSGSTFQLWSAGDAGYNANNLYRNSLAKYVIASTDEWYKGAYGSPNGTWYDYTTGRDTAPSAASGGTAANTAVFGQSPFAGPANVNNAGGLSPYETMGQGGNAWEWTETAYDGINNTAGEDRVVRGGAWYEASGKMNSASSASVLPLNGSNEGADVGFRVAIIVPEPSTGLLVVLGLSGLLLKRRK